VHRHPTRPASSVAARVVLLVAAYALVATGCVLKHPSDPANAASKQWYKQHADDARALVASSLLVMNPSVNVGTSAYYDLCTTMRDKAVAAQKLPPVPSKTLQFQWNSGLKFLELGGNDCINSINNTTAATWQVNNTLRDKGRDDITFGQIRLQAIMNAFGSNANPLTPGLVPGRTIPLH
jgi:hypothetical protein